MSDQVAPVSRLTGDRPAAISPLSPEDRRELAFVAFERSRIPMVVTDPHQPDNPIVMANRAFMEFTGFSAEETIGHNCRFLQGPKTDPRALDEIRRAVAEVRDCTVDILNYRKNGTPFWNQLFISPVRDDDGALLYFYASQMDVTDRHTAQALAAEEHRLLREVDHRAKNALALVQGIVRLSRSDDAEAYAQAVQGRVDALARAHSLLADNGWRDARIDRVIRAEAEPFGGKRFDITGPETEIAAAQVQPLALLLHELMANAAQHGALSVPAGRVAVRWQEDGADGLFRIDWRESHGPAPSADRRRGFGTSMMAAIITRQLNGRMTSDWAETGLICEVSFPRHPSRAGPPAVSAR